MELVKAATAARLRRKPCAKPHKPVAVANGASVTTHVEKADQAVGAVASKLCDPIMLGQPEDELETAVAAAIGSAVGVASTPAASTSTSTTFQLNHHYHNDDDDDILYLDLIAALPGPLSL